jgi:site-specific recombinase XerD
VSSQNDASRSKDPVKTVLSLKKTGKLWTDYVPCPISVPSPVEAHLRHRFGYRMAERVPLHRLAQIMGHDSLDTTMLYVKGTQQDLQQAVETIAWE